MKYVVTSPDILRQTCIDNNWFTHGDDTQYDKLFEANAKMVKANTTIQDIALIIWICSEAKYYDIKAKLDDLHGEYLYKLYE